MKGRAKRKLITQKTVLSLIDVVEKNGNDERKKVTGILNIVKIKFTQSKENYFRRWYGKAYQQHTQPSQTVKKFHTLILFQI